MGHARGTGHAGEPRRRADAGSSADAVAEGRGEVWIEHDSGLMLAVVVGGARAMVLRLAEAGDAGQHAISPDASPDPSEEYVLANGQVDRYADRDAVEVRHVAPIVTHFLATTDRWPGVEWEDDNAE